MMKIVLVMALALVLGAAPVFGQPEKADKDLIKVFPSYQEASYVPSRSGETGPTNTISQPSPKDQMYVFWFLGRALSYPVDKVESLVSNWRAKRAEKAIATPASSSGVPNPFDSVKWREIPPAPPAVAGPVTSKEPADSK